MSTHQFRTVERYIGLLEGVIVHVETRRMSYRGIFLGVWEVGGTPRRDKAWPTKNSKILHVLLHRHHRVIVRHNTIALASDPYQRASNGGSDTQIRSVVVKLCGRMSPKFGQK